MYKNLKLKFIFLSLAAASCSIFAQDETTPAANSVKAEDIVEKVLNDSLNPANLKGGSTKVITDLTSTFAAFAGFLFTQNFLPAAAKNNPQANNLISIGVSLVALRAVRVLMQNLSKIVSWDPRDLAVANALIAAAESGSIVTSDFDSVKKLLDEVAPIVCVDGQTRTKILMSNADKIKLSQAIRSYMFAGKHHRSLITRSKGITSKSDSKK